MANYAHVRRIVGIAILGIFGVLISAPPSPGTEIGFVTAANPRIDGTPPGAEQRVLLLGTRVLADELIVTSQIGSGQFVFLDQTTLTVSPGSEIVLDRYVFDPARGSGEIALTMTKGVLRFIGGKVTKGGEAIVMTPHATIGIRGGIAAITVDDAGTNSVFLAGANMCVTGKDKKLCVSRPGGVVSIKAAPADGSAGDSAPASDPSATSAADEDSGEPVYQGVASPQQIGVIYNSTNTGGSGGTTQTINPVTVNTLASSTGLTNVGASSVGATSQTPVSTQGEEEPEVETAQDDPSSATRTQPQTTVAAQPPDMIVDVWVGGVKSDIAALGTSGEAFFDGFAVADVTEIGGGAPVTTVDDGRYLMTFDFGSRTGAATITGIAGTVFTSSVSQGAAPAGEHFGGVLFDTMNFSAVGSIGGSFFTNGADPAAATGGAFDFNRSLGGGITQTGEGTFEASNVTN